MTRLPIGPGCLPNPRSVILGEAAIAAGMAGHGIALCWQDFPAPILCELWKHFAACAGPGRVRQISSQADVRKLSEHVAAPRLVLVHAPRLHNATAWAIQMASPTVGALSRPAVFSRFAPLEADEDPGATLVVRGNTNECATIRQWLAVGSRGGFDWAHLPAQGTTGMPPALESLLAADCSPNERGLRRFRDRQVLHGLLAGACLLRAARQEVQPESSLAVNLEDYELVRGVLQSPIVASADDSFDPLAAAMVSRANVYMSVKFGDYSDSRNPFRESGEESDPVANRSGRELITRREVADLGNVHSRLVRRLIEFLRRRPDGYKRFLAMGVVRRPPNRNAWRAVDIDELIGYLRRWSAKQVRTHFGRLCSAGMISAERDHGNGPWRYVLPEELNGQRSVFRGLPTAQELLGHAQAG
jgi:hypothetical protein